jgi:DNA-binding CsgD family transcriptional regulator
MTGQSTARSVGKAKTPMLPTLQLVSAWTAALQGMGDLGQAAEQVMGLFPVHDISLLRINLGTGETKRIHASAGAPVRDDIEGVGDLRLCLGEVVRDQNADRRIIVLCSNTNHTDLFVLRLSRPLSAAQGTLLQELAAALATSWSHRQPGLVTARILAFSRRYGPRERLRKAESILDYSNPYALSRAEFRVCAMIGQGLTAKRIAHELRLSEATVRSHQRAIYAKTELGGQMEVMYHLQAHPTAQSLLNGLQGRAA